MSFLMNFLIVITLFIFTTKLENVITNPVENFRNSDVKLRITGGQLATHKQFPFMAALISELDNIHASPRSSLCGGALISPNTVLTSVGCIEGRKEITVVLGTKNLTANERTKQSFVCNSSYFITYPNYDSFSLKPNLAIIKLPTPAKLTYEVHVIGLPSDDIDHYTKKYATVFGWGTATIKNPVSDMQHLRYTANQVLTNDRCKNMNNLTKAVVDDTMMCLSGARRDNHNSSRLCTGDTGGPLVYNKNVLIGILAFYHQECDEKLPSVYTRTNKYLPWIHQHMH